MNFRKYINCSNDNVQSLAQQSCARALWQAGWSYWSAGQIQAVKIPLMLELTTKMLLLNKIVKLRFSVASNAVT